MRPGGTGRHRVVLGTGQAQRQEQPGSPQCSPARCRWQHQDLQPLTPCCGVKAAALPPGSPGPSQLHVKEFCFRTSLRAAAGGKLLRDAPERQRAQRRLTTGHVLKDTARVGSRWAQNTAREAARGCSTERPGRGTRGAPGAVQRGSVQCPALTQPPLAWVGAAPRHGEHKQDQAT